MAQPDATQNHEEPGGADRSFADLLDFLFKNDPRGPFTNPQVATLLQEAGLTTASSTYLWQLRTGQRDNPTKHHIEGFARFFGVPEAYFFESHTQQVIGTLLGMLNDLKAKQGVTAGQLHTQLAALSSLLERGVTADQVIAQLETLHRLNEAGVTLETLNRFDDAGVTGIAMRAVGLSEKGLNAAAAMLDQVRRLEGLETEHDQI